MAVSRVKPVVGGHQPQDVGARRPVRARGARCGNESRTPRTSRGRVRTTCAARPTGQPGCTIRRARPAPCSLLLAIVDPPERGCRRHLPGRRRSFASAPLVPASPLASLARPVGSPSGACHEDRPEDRMSSAHWRFTVRRRSTGDPHAADHQQLASRRLKPQWISTWRRRPRRGLSGRSRSARLPAGVAGDRQVAAAHCRPISGGDGAWHPRHRGHSLSIRLSGRLG